MNVIVCMKQVPDTETLIKIKSDGSGIVTDDIKYVMNPYCEFAVEESLRIREKFGGQSILITMGPQRAVEALRTGLAMGADRAVHLNDPAFEGADGLATAKALAEVIKKESFDLILCGKQAVDDDMAQVGQSLAELLNLPHVTLVTKLELVPDQKKAKATREVDGGREVVDVGLPAVFTCQKGLNEPRYASLPGIMKAKKKEVRPINLAGLGLPADQVGAAGSKIKIRKYFPPPSRPPGKMVSGELAEAAKQLVKLLREEAKII
ncbi:MAG: electron transfer flavoprotein subunit beta/FixA family protein [Candidatus Aminicenantes bacterium]|nr:electron transfer flavoprotein subunit beta/FixA family protein [Candidatus Aminicenantes bacterium]